MVRNRKLTLEALPCLSVTKLRRNGLMKSGRVCHGVAGWTQKSGTTVMSADITVSTEPDAPHVTVSYRIGSKLKGEEVIPLRWIRSNLQFGGGYYMFACPVSGATSRKLYFFKGHFVNQAVTGIPYRSQCLDRAGKTREARAARHYDKYIELTDKKNRRMTYNGKPTRYAKTIERLESIFGMMLF